MVKKIFKIIGIVLLTLVIFISIGFACGYFYINSKLSKMQQVEINVENLAVEEEVEQKLSGYRNIALFGVDSRDGNLDRGNRSDCIIIASINNDTKEIKLVSVYRDTYVDIDGHGLDKINHAYSFGGPELALKTLNKNLDLNVTEFVTVNFEAVADAVDALGGVEINITSDELYYLNSGIRDTANHTGKEANIVTETGLQTLDGVQAVAYSRIRYTSGGDYKRTERMRTVIEAMFQKIKTKSIVEINNLADKILPEILTNIEPSEIFAMIPYALNYKITESIGWPYKVKGYTGAAWYGAPVTLEKNVKQLHLEAFQEEDYTVSDTVKKISDKIIKKTGYDN